MNTILKSTVLSVAFAVGASAASAAVLDFADYIDNVTGETQGDPLVIFDAVHVPIETTANGWTGSQSDSFDDYGTAAVAYGDFNTAGLGVCRDPIEPSENFSTNECNPSSDDNLQEGEILSLSFSETLFLEGMGSRGEGHPNDSFDATDMFAYSLDLGETWLTAAITLFDPSSDSGFTMFENPILLEAGETILFTFENEQYYVSGLSVSQVPLPAAGWLLLGGLGGIAALKRRRKS